MRVSFKRLILTFLIVAWPAATLAVPSSTDTTTRVAQVQTDRINNLKARADLEITRRLTTLNKMLARLNGTKGRVQKLSTANKTALVAQINTEIAGLTALKTKIDSTTYASITDLMNDVKSIISDYRVYLLIAKKVAIIVAADSTLAAADKFVVMETALTKVINQAKADGKDVVDAQKRYDEVVAKVNDAKAKGTSVETMVLPLQPNDYNENHEVLSTPVADLKASRADLTTAKIDAQTILKDLGAPTTTTK